MYSKAIATEESTTFTTKEEIECQLQYFVELIRGLHKLHRPFRKARNRHEAYMKEIARLGALAAEGTGMAKKLNEEQETLDTDISTLDPQDYEKRKIFASFLLRCNQWCDRKKEFDDLVEINKQKDDEMNKNAPEVDRLQYEGKRTENLIKEQCGILQAYGIRFKGRAGKVTSKAIIDHDSLHELGFTEQELKKIGLLKNPDFFDLTGMGFPDPSNIIEESMEKTAVT